MSIDNNDLQQMILLLQKMIVDNSSSTENESSVMNVQESKKTKSKIRTKGNKNKNKTNVEHYNKFLDMPESKMHKEDTIIDKKLNISQPTPRVRPFNFIDVKCRVCGKTETLNPALVENVSRYKCNSCSSSPG